MKLVTAQEMGQIELEAARSVSMDQLMENAGNEVCEFIIAHENLSKSRRFVVLVGPGNNGGDGLVVARFLAIMGLDVAVFLMTAKALQSKLDLAVEAGAKLFEYGYSRETLAQHCSEADIIVDAVFGTGKSKPIAPELGSMLQAAQCGVPIWAIDLPTGLDSDSGKFDPNGIRATHTVTLGLMKLGLAITEAEGYAGKIHIADIGIPNDLEAIRKVDPELVDRELARTLLPVRKMNSHKGTFGTTVIMAGSINYPGAALLAAGAAARSGTGLVKLAVPQSIYPAVAGRIAEVVMAPLPDDSQGHFTEASLDGFRECVKGARAVLLGSGWDSFSELDLVLQEALASIDEGATVVLDANTLHNPLLLRTYENRNRLKFILTPHPGEMARLLNRSNAEIQSARYTAALTAAREFNACVVLKGANTIIAEPQQRTRISSCINSGMAKGGSGDVLAGLTAGLAAQIADPFDAATLSVYLHGLAGSYARDAKSEYGMLPSDITSELGRALLDSVSSDTVQHNHHHHSD